MDVVAIASGAAILALGSLVHPLLVLAAGARLGWLVRL